MIYFIVVIVLAVVFVPAFLTAPRIGCKRAEVWKGTAFAHRGLHDEQVSENSVEAFERACRAGVGIELDVQLTKDSQLVVFHDSDLERLMGDKRPVAELTLSELREFVLPDGSCVPTFAEVLSLVNGRVPLLVELKNGKRLRELCEKTYAQLKNYSGKYVVESFQPVILLWFRLHARDVVRGQLVAAWEEYVEDYGGFVASVLTNLLCNFLARPDFVAYDLTGKARFGMKLQNKLFHTPMAVWTVKTPEDYSAAVQKGEMPIFEGFVPEHLKK